MKTTYTQDEAIELCHQAHPVVQIMLMNAQERIEQLERERDVWRVIAFAAIALGAYLVKSLP